jgi:enolase
MILPYGATSFAESLRIGIEVYHSLASLIKKKFGKSAANVGDEGGFGAPQLKDENHTLEIVEEAIHNSGHAGRIFLGLDVAASEFYDAKNNKYNLSQKTGLNDRIITPDALIDIYDNLSKKYPIISIEDPFD